MRKGPPEDARTADAEPQLIGGERIKHGVGGREGNKRGLEDCELGQQRRLVVDKLRHEGKEEGDALRIESGDREGVAEDTAVVRLLFAEIGQGGRRTPEANAEVDQIGGANQLQDRE